MDTLDLLLDGLQNALTLENLLYAAIGVLLGTFVGVLPGIGPAMAVALLLPITYGLDVTQSMIIFAGIYYGGMYGGSTTSILLNTPGESASVMTAIEGNKMAKKGRAAQALATAAIGSFIAGTIGTLLVAFFTPALADQAVKVGAPSYFAIMLLAMVLVCSVLGASKLRGFIGLFMGLTIGLVGLDLSTAQARLTGGWLELADGIDIVVVAVGVFAVGEALWTAAHLRRRPVDVIPVGRPFMAREDWRRSWAPWLRGTALGFPFGAVPAGGAETPTFLSYLTERKLAARRGVDDEFGQGAIEGVAGPEAANNASAAGMFVPLLALGLPVTATASILLAALTSYGIVPGPTLMTDQPDLIWTLLASLLIGNALLLVINLPLAPLWAKLLRIPRPSSTPASCSSPRSVPTASTRTRSTWPSCWPWAPWVDDPAVRHPGAAADPRRHPRAPHGAQAPRGAGPVRAATSAGCSTRASRSSSTSWSCWRSSSRSCWAGCDRAVPSETLVEGGVRAMTVVVGYIPDQYGEAALAAGIEEAGRRQTDLVVVNATKGDALVDRRYVGDAGSRRTRTSGWTPWSLPTDRTADDGRRRGRGAGAGGPGDRGRGDRHRPAPPHPRRQDDHGQRRPAGAPGRTVLGDRGQARLSWSGAPAAVSAGPAAPRGCPL